MATPMAAVVAAEEPERAAKNMPATATTRASPPARAPTRAFAKSTSRFVTPPEDMKEPASMKKGTAMKEKESMEVNMRWATTTRGTFMVA